MPALPLVQLLVAGLVGTLLISIARRWWQRCPHCRRFVPRANRGWLRCRHCGRQYHRSVQLRR